MKMLILKVEGDVGHQMYTKYGNHKKRRTQEIKVFHLATWTNQTEHLKYNIQ